MHILYTNIRLMCDGSGGGGGGGSDGTSIRTSNIK